MAQPMPLTKSLVCARHHLVTTPFQRLAPNDDRWRIHRWHRQEPDDAAVYVIITNPKHRYGSHGAGLAAVEVSVGS